MMPEARGNVIESLETPAAQTLLRRHAAFWALEPTDAPLIKRARRSGTLPRPADQSVRLKPERLWDGLLGHLERLEARYDASGIVDGDLFRVAELPGRPPWMPALLGCPIWVSRPSGAMRWGLAPGGWEALRDLSPSAGRAWRDALRQGLRQMVARWGERYPIATFHGRGPADMLAQALGDEALALRVIDAPESLAPVLTELTRLWIDVAREFLHAIQPAAGGAFHRYGLWAPGPLASMTVDAAALFSVETYSQVFLPHDRAIQGALDHLLIHAHSGALRHHVNWQALPGVAIQVLEDPGAGWSAMAPALTALHQSGHPLLLSLSEESLASAHAELSPQGLALEAHHTV